MIKEKNDVARALISEHMEGLRKNSDYRMCGQCNDPNSNETCAISVPGLKQSPGVEEKLTAAGFMVIYPAELSAEAVARMDDVERATYERNLQNGLVVDSHEECLSGNFLNHISEHYYSASHHRMAGTTSHDMGSITTEYQYFDSAEDTNAKYADLVSRLGFMTKKNENGSVDVFSELPYISNIPEMTGSIQR